MKTQNETYNGMTGGLFDGQPLEFVGKPRANKGDLLLEIAKLKTSDCAGRILLTRRLWQSLGRNGGPSEAFLARVDYEVSTALDAASRASKAALVQGTSKPSAEAASETAKRMLGISAGTLEKVYGVTQD